VDSRGGPGDSVGHIYIDENFFYACIQNFSYEGYDSGNHIWKRISFSGSTWSS
jgi:hypothetical protein